MQYLEPDDGAWPARVLRNRRLNQTPEKENTATRLRFMHQRRIRAPAKARYAQRFQPMPTSTHRKTT
jgi:hypothetical protein